MYNQQFNSWRVIDDEKIYKDTGVYYKCECKCGTLKDVLIKNLKSGISKSCGCINLKKLLERSTKHNKRHTRIWRIWQAMLNRCRNKNVKGYERYGGRGIKVCEDWKQFENFYKDMGGPPTNEHSIERIDNNGNYELSNCKWATREEQNKNRSSNHKINGECITDISKRLGGGHALVGKRLRRGWTIEEAIKYKSNAIK